MIPATQGKLAILFAGFGGLSTGFMAKCLLGRRGVRRSSLFECLPLSAPEKRELGRIADALQLKSLNDLVFGGWDAFLENAAVRLDFAEAIDSAEAAPILPELRIIKPMRAVFYREYPVGVFGTFSKRLPSKGAMVEALGEDIRNFLDIHTAEQAVGVWCGSPELVPPPTAHESILSFTRGLETNDPSITNSQIYAWASSVINNMPFLSVEANGCVLYPALRQLARERRVPLAGEGFPTFPPPVDPATATDSDRKARRKAIEMTVPLLLETILLLDRAHQSGWTDLQDWLGIYFTAPGQDRAVQVRHFMEAVSRLAEKARPPA
jgi:myo-inositol-1-phosphate synthase